MMKSWPHGSRVKRHVKSHVKIKFYFYPGDNGEQMRFLSRRWG